jgi:hypothetical protein
LQEAQADITAFINEFQGCDVRVVSANLTVADHTVTGELKSGKTKFYDAHLINQLAIVIYQ